MTAIVDTYAWLEFLSGTALGLRVGETLGTAELVVTPDIVVAEVARKFSRDGASPLLTRRRLAELGTLSRIFPVTADVAMGVHAADLVLRLNAKAQSLDRPGLSDAIILSTARILGGSILTGDPHFRGLPETSWLGA